MNAQAAYVANLKPQLDTMRAAMREMDAQAERAHVDVRARFKGQMGRLHDQARRAYALLHALGSVDGDAWQELVVGMERMRDALHSSIRYFKSQF